MGHKQEIFKYGRQGFSMVEAVVGLGLMGFAVAAVGMLSGHSAKLLSAARGGGDYARMVTILKERFRYRDTCLATLNGGVLSQTPAALAGSPDTVEEMAPSINGIRIGMPNPNVVSRAAGQNDLGGGRFTVTSLHLRDFVVVPGAVADDPLTGNDEAAERSLLLAQMVLIAEDGGRAMRPSDIASLALVVHNVDRTILDCRSSSDNLQDVCTAMGGCTFNPLGTPPCVCNRPRLGCNPGELPVAIRNGVMVCEPWGGRCPAGQALRAAGRGRAVCSQLVQDCTVTSAHVNWGSACTATTPPSLPQTLKYGQFLTFVDSERDASNPGGSITWKCVQGPDPVQASPPSCAVASVPIPSPPPDCGAQSFSWGPGKRCSADVPSGAIGSNHSASFDGTDYSGSAEFVCQTAATVSTSAWYFKYGVAPVCRQKPFVHWVMKEIEGEQDKCYVHKTRNTNTNCGAVQRVAKDARRMDECRRNALSYLTAATGISAANMTSEEISLTPDPCNTGQPNAWLKITVTPPP